MMKLKRETLIVGSLCVAWYTLSSASNVVGKIVLTEFPFPLTVTLVQLLSTVAYSAPALAAFRVRRAPSFPLRFYGRALVPLAFAKFLTTMFSQVSIWKVPVSYAHTVKATTPLWTAGLSWLLFGERQSRGVQVALVLIAAGVALASATELSFHTLGLAAALAAAALLSLQHLFSKRLMRDTTIHHLRLLQILSALALVPVVPVWAVVEGHAVLGGGGAGWELRGSTAALLAADGALAWLQAVAAFTVLSRVSPLGYAVASAAKRAAVVLASLLLLRNPAPPLNLLAMALTVLAVLAYNRAKIYERSATASAAAPLLPILSALALVPVVPVWAVVEGHAVLGGGGAGWELRGSTAALQAADGALAWLQAVAAFTVLSRVSPLGYAVASAAKRAAVVLASLLLLRNPAPPLNLLAMALTVLAVLAYNRAKIYERSATASAAAPLLPV